MTNENSDNTPEKHEKAKNDWYPGMESPNPDGKPKGSKNYLTLLEEALEKRAVKENVSYYDKLAEWCFRYPKTATAILKKFVADKTQTEIINPEPVNIIIHHAKD